MATWRCFATRHQYPSDKPESAHKLTNFCCCSFHSGRPKFLNLEDPSRSSFSVGCDDDSYQLPCAITDAAFNFIDFVSEDSVSHHKFYSGGPLQDFSSASFDWQDFRALAPDDHYFIYCFAGMMDSS